LHLRKTSVIICISLLALLLSGCGKTKYAVDPQSGIMVRQDNPEKTIVTYYELLGAGSYEAAHGLYSKSSRENIPVEMLERVIRVNNLENATLAQVFPARLAGDLAIVAHIQVNRFPGMDTEVPMFGISTLRKEGKVWAMVRDWDELSKEQTLAVARLMVEADKEVEAAIPDMNLDENQLSRLLAQLNMLRTQHEEIVFALEDPEAYMEKQRANMSEEDADRDDDPFERPRDHDFFDFENDAMEGYENSSFH